MNQFQQRTSVGIESVKPAEAFSEMRCFVERACNRLPTSGCAAIQVYLEHRGTHEAAIRQDLLPLFVYHAVVGQDYRAAIPLASAWALSLAASHTMNRIQDTEQNRQQSLAEMNQAAVALGIADIALANLEVEVDTLRDILDAMGRTTALAANAQSWELQQGRTWTRRQYLGYVASKSASIIATGAWMGGRLATDDGRTLQMLKEFGLALGMAMQIADDCLDLVPDLMSGTHTLPVIEGLLMEHHPDHALLKRLINRPALGREEAEAAAALLEEMGAVNASRRVVQAYQAQAAAIFGLFPAMEHYFGSAYHAPG